MSRFSFWKSRTSSLRMYDWQYGNIGTLITSPLKPGRVRPWQRYSNDRPLASRTTTMLGYRSPPTPLSSLRVAPARTEPAQPALRQHSETWCQTHRRPRCSLHAFFCRDLFVSVFPVNRPSIHLPFRRPPSASETASDASSLGAVRRGNLSVAE